MDSGLKTIKVFSNTTQLEKAFEKKSIRTLRIGDRKVCLAKVKSEYFAFEALCPHQKHNLADSTINAFNEVICPLHFYRFNLKTGSEANRLCRDLSTFPTELNDEGFFIKLY